MPNYEKLHLLQRTKVVCVLVILKIFDLRRRNFVKNAFRYNLIDYTELRIGLLPEESKECLVHK